MLANSGCVTKQPIYLVEGLDDYFEIPIGTELYIQNFQAANGEPAMMKVNTMKPGAFFSTDAQADVLQARAKS